MLDKTAQLKAQIKLAESMLRLDAINKELAKYNVRSLQKSAAFGRDKVTRLKVAALIRQRELEKKAFAGAIGALGRGIGNAYNTASNYLQDRGISGAVRDAGQGISNMANSAADGIEAVGKIPQQMYRKGQQMYHNVMSPVRNVAAGVQGFGQGMYQGAKSMASLPGALANTAYQGFTGQLGQSMPNMPKMPAPAQPKPPSVLTGGF